MAQGEAVTRYDPPPTPMASQTIAGGGYDPPPDPGADGMQVSRRPLQMQTGSVASPPGAVEPIKPKKGRDGPYQKHSEDLGPPADGIMDVPFPIGPANPVPTVPVTPTPKAIVRRNRPGPYEQPAEEEPLDPPADGIMNLPFPLGPQPTAIEEDRAMSSSFVPKRPSETPLAATASKKPASSPQP